jgi:hypothetical protein
MIQARKKKKTPSFIAISCALARLRAMNMYYGKWISDKVICQLLYENRAICKLDESYINVTSLRTAFGRVELSRLLQLHTPNNSGIFYRSIQKKRDGWTNKKESYIYFTKRKSSIPPLKTSTWLSSVVTSICQIERRRSMRLKNTPPIQTNPVTPTISPETQPKPESLDSLKMNNIEVDIMDECLSEDEKNSDILRMQCRLDSPEALELFAGSAVAQGLKKETNQDKTNQAEFIRSHLKTQICTLKKAFATVNGWKAIIDQPEQSDMCSETDIFHLRLKARYMYAALAHALNIYDHSDNTQLQPTFQHICELAIESVDHPLDKLYDDSLDDDTGKSLSVKNPQTIMRWIRSWRDTSSLPNPAIVRAGRHVLPTLMHNNPDLHKSFLQYARANIKNLSTEMMHQYLLMTALPEIAKKVEKNLKKDECYSVPQLLHDNGLSNLSLSTVHNWMTCMGFSYTPHKKTYYVDNHEKPENVLYRSKFIDRYFSYELCAHRWLLVPEAKVLKMKADGELSNKKGYKVQKDNETYYEYHVDDHITFQDECASLPFGGNLSVRKPANKNPALIFGQDECIFKQYLTNGKTWCMPDGTKPLLPKDEGQGLMVSAFTSRDLGFGLNISPAQLDEINQKMRGKGKKYLDESAAIMKNGTSQKRYLKTSPFVQYLTYGANADGYWTYEAMVLQMEDIVDCLKVLYPSYDYILLFDHSNGHDKKQPNGLNANRVSKNFGGVQPKMRNTKLTDTNCFGSFHSRTYKHQLGDVQEMVFKESDEGPITLSPEEREKRKYDKKTGKTRSKPIKKEKLMDMMKEMGVKHPSGNLKQLQEKAKALSLPVTYLEDVIREGWVGKPKGALQILYERGWIDPTNIKKYTEKGSVSKFGILDETTSTTLLLAKQPDFIGELTLLQYYATKLGVTADRTPKCHPELAGEGIEYLWALAKLFYRGARIERKRNRNMFNRLVQECLCGKKNLHLARARGCSRRAREYMLAYKAIEQLQKEESDLVCHTTNESCSSALSKNNCKQRRAMKTEYVPAIEMNHQLIEKTIKTYKSHRNAATFDVAFVQSLKGLDNEKASLVKRIVMKMDCA